MTSQPAENVQPSENVSPANQGAPKLPTTQELLDQATAQQKLAAQGSGSQPVFTPSSIPSDVPPATPKRSLDTVALMRAMGDFVKAQNAFIHNKELPQLATAQEQHIYALTTALEQLGVL